MNKVFHLLYIIVIVVLVTLLFSSKRQIKVVENRVTDTILKIRVDTLTRYVPKYVTKKTTDTIYLQANDKNEVAIEIEQKHYSENGVYDAWISGYKPQLDSIKTYPRVEYRTITNSVTKEILVKKWNFYTCIGFKRFSDEYVPSVGFIAKSPRNSLYGVEVGAINGNLYYGLTYGFILK
jgi:hypothetical protein